MKLYFDKRAKDPTYYGQVGIRNGKKTTTKNVKNFGKHSELLKITDDPVSYVRDLIKQYNEESRVGHDSVTFSIDFNEKVENTGSLYSAATQVNIGYFFLQDIMKGLELKKFFKDICKDMNITFDPYTINRFLTYSRIMDPASKLQTQKQFQNYYEKPQIEYQHILRYMDILSGSYSKYLSWLYKKSNNVIQRDTSVLYYDCTNFYFETERPDDDYVDEVTGEVMRGLRQYYVSKEHRPNPLVEMGLLMDKDGIPISMTIVPGNTNEQITAIPLETEVSRMIENSKFIYCSDGGLGSYNIRKFNSMGGRAFIVTQSIKKLSEELQNNIFDDHNYKLLSNDSSCSIKFMKEFDRTSPDNLSLYNDKIYKFIPADKVCELGLYEERQLKNGKIKSYKAKGTLKQVLIVTFSRKMFEYQRAIRERQIERAKNYLKYNDPEEIKKGPNDIKRFMKRVAKGKDGSEAKVTYEIDWDKIHEEEKYDGFYATATNLDDPAKDILAVQAKRYQVEDCFRIMKTNFEGRPVYHQIEDRIKAHFLICYTALLVYRLLEVKINRSGKHITCNNLIETLRNLNVTNVHDVEYMALYKGSQALDILNQISSFDLGFMHYHPKDLNKNIKKILE